MAGTPDLTSAVLVFPVTISATRHIVGEVFIIPKRFPLTVK